MEPDPSAEQSPSEATPVAPAPADLAPSATGLVVGDGSEPEETDSDGETGTERP